MTADAGPTAHIDPLVVRLPDGHRWLRVADPAWDDPLDPSYAATHGGRWNPPRSFPTLYLNEDLATARAQVIRLLVDTPVRPEDLDDGAYVLVVATLPRSQTAADAVSDEGLRRLDLPVTYPQDRHGRILPRARCRPIGAQVHAQGIRGVHARSAATPDGSGRELAWFPARADSRARPVGEPLPWSRWWSADTV